MQILPHCVWVDNYYKYFRTSYPKASTGLRKDCAWTVSARVSVPFHLNDNFELDIIRREGMPAMPPNLFADDYVKELITAYSKFESIRVNELCRKTSNAFHSNQKETIRSLNKLSSRVGFHNITSQAMKDWCLFLPN